MQNLGITPQRIVVFFLGLLFLAIAFPPWEFTYITKHGKLNQPAGFSFVLTPPKTTETNALVDVSISLSRLSITVLAIISAFIFASVLHGHLSAKAFAEKYFKEQGPPSLGDVATLIEIGRYDEAIRGCDSILASDPKNPGAYFGLGVCFLMKDDVEIAEKYIAKAASLGDPKAREYFLKKNLPSA
jgi:tetratricopeptide (TPR) repeat protein